MKIALLGSSGQLGNCIKKILKKKNFNFIYFNRKQLDITNLKNIKINLSKHNPTVLINCAAFTDVEGAELDRKKAFLINETGTKNVSIICSKMNILHIYISTDYVFSGTSKKPYKPNSKTYPISIYGKSKLAGEKKVKKFSKFYMIIRTAWLYSEYGNNFLKKIIYLIKNDKLKKIIIKNNEFGSPTYADFLAAAIVSSLSKITKKNTNKTYHYAGDTCYSRINFTKIIVAQAFKKRIINFIPKIYFSKLHKKIFLANRPPYSALDSNNFIDTFAIKKYKNIKGIQKALSNLSR